MVFPLIALIALGAFFHSTPGSAHQSHFFRHFNCFWFSGLLGVSVSLRLSTFAPVCLRLLAFSPLHLLVFVSVCLRLFAFARICLRPPLLRPPLRDTDCEFKLRSSNQTGMHSTNSGRG